MTDPSPVDVSSLAIDRAIERLKALPDYAGRPAWDKIVAEEIAAALASHNTEADALREALERIRKPGVGAALDWSVEEACNYWKSIVFRNREIADAALKQELKG
jgi:hypothetical protein